MEQQERYYNYMLRNMREEDKKVGKENAMSNAKRMIWVTFPRKVFQYPVVLEDPLATGDEYDVFF